MLISKKYFKMYNSVVNLHVRILNQAQILVSTCIDEYNLITSSHSDVYQGFINKR